MGVLWALLIWAIFGLIAGAVARLLVPGRQSMGLGMTMLLGIVGSFAGGFLAWLFVGGSPFQASGFILSILGATLLLAISVYAGRRRTSA